MKQLLSLDHSVWLQSPVSFFDLFFVIYLICRFKSPVLWPNILLDIQCQRKKKAAVQVLLSGLRMFS